VQSSIDVFDNLEKTIFCRTTVGAIHESPVYKIKQNLISAIKTKDLLTKFCWFLSLNGRFVNRPYKIRIKFSSSEFIVQ